MAAKYKAFISYSHADSRRGEWLHKVLEGYRVPSSYVGLKSDAGERVETRLGKIFRDRDELTSGHDLAEAIREALAASENLVVVCSPAAARSRYVNQEIIEFKRLGKADRVHAVIVAGEPHASAIPGAEEQECLPAALRFALDDDGRLTDRAGLEILAPDLRSGKDEKNRALIKLIAGLLRVDFDTLYQRDRRRARRRTLALGAVTGGVVLTLALLGWAALNRSQEATRQQRLVKHNGYETKLGLAETSERAGDHDGAVAVLKDELPAPGEVDMREFVWRYLWRPYDRHRHVVFVSNELSSLDISPDGQRFAIADDSPLVTLWDVTTGEEVGRIEGRNEIFKTALFVAGGTRIVTENQDGNVRLWNPDDLRAPARDLGNSLYPVLSRERRILVAGNRPSATLSEAKLIDVEHGTETAVGSVGYSFGIDSSSISADGRTVAFADSHNALVVIDASTGHLLHRREFPPDWRLEDIDFTPDGALLLRGEGPATGVELRVWDPATNREGPILHGIGQNQPNAASVAMTPNGDKVGLLLGDPKNSSPRQQSHVIVWERRTGRILYTLGQEQTGFVTAMQFSPTTDVLATGSRDDYVRLWDASTGTLKGVVGLHQGTPTRDGEQRRFHGQQGTSFYVSPKTPETGITKLLFSADGKSILTASGEPGVRVWNATVDPDGQELPTRGDSQTAVGFSADGRSVVTGDRTGVVATWNATTGERHAQATGHLAPVLGLAFSPSADRIISASEDGMLTLWRMPQLIAEESWIGPAGSTENLVLGTDRVTHLTRHDSTYELKLFTLDGKPKPGGTTMTAAAVALSPDARTLAAFTAGGSSPSCGLILWDVERAQSTSVTLGPKGCGSFDISQIAWSPDGTLLAAGGTKVSFGGSEFDGSVQGVRVFDVRSGRERALLSVPVHRRLGGRQGLAFSPDGRLLVALDVVPDPENAQHPAIPERSAVIVWDVATFTRKEMLQVPQELCTGGDAAGCLSAAAFSPDSMVLSVATAGQEIGGSRVLFWRVGEKGFDTEFVRGTVGSLLFSPSGDRVATLMQSRDNGEPAILWDPRAARQVAVLGNYAPRISALHFSRDGHVLAQTLEYPATSGGVARVWDLQTGRSIASITNSSPSGHPTIEVSPDGQLLADLSATGVVTIRKIGGSEPLASLQTAIEKERPSGLPPAVMFSSDATLLATFGMTQTTVWDLAARKAIHTLTGTLPAAVSGDGRILATTDIGSKTIVAWDMASGRQRGRVILQKGYPTALALSPDGTRLLVIRTEFGSAADGTVWDVGTGTVVTPLGGYTDDANAVAAFSPDGLTLVTAGIGGVVNLWDPLTGHRLITLSGPPVEVSSLSFSRDGDTLVVGYRTEVRFWRAARGRRP